MRVPGTILRLGSSRRFCVYCGFEMIRGDRLAAPSWDHVLPKSRGGTDDPTNLRRCCRSCNEVLSLVGECVGAFACVRAVVESSADLPSHRALHSHMRRIGKDWNRRRGRFLALPVEE